MDLTMYNDPTAQTKIISCSCKITVQVNRLASELHLVVI